MVDLTFPRRGRGNRAVRATRLLSATVLLACLVGGSVLAAPGPAEAIACGSPVVAGTSCTLTGTLTISAGSLTLQMPSSLTWSATLNGTNQQVADAISGDQQYVVDDATGSGAGWHVTTSATTFTTGSVNLANSGTFSTNGSTSSASSTTAPSTGCGAGSTCTLPTNNTTYPVAITTAASLPTAYTIYDTSATTGEGVIDIGTVGWWLALPSNVATGTYTSTITMQIITGP